MKLSPQPHAHSLQSQFEAYCLTRGVKLGMLAVAGPDAYASPAVQAAWLAWLDDPSQLPEPFDDGIKSSASALQ